MLRLPIGEWVTPRSGSHSASRHQGIQRLRDVEPGCIVLYLELHGRAIAFAGVEPSEILHTPNQFFYYIIFCLVIENLNDDRESYHIVYNIYFLLRRNDI